VTENALAFDTLVAMAELSLSHAKGLPAQVDVKPYWSGVGFSLFGARYVAPMGEVSEMLEMPHFTRLPGVTDWVKGVSNVRGRLLPLADMAVFLGGKLISAWRQQRVLVIEVDEIYSGLVVDAVFGVQHFPVDSYSPVVKSGIFGNEMVPFVQGAFMNDEGEEWTVFSPWSLARNERFFQAALSAS
jgi:twitching motility protein PilI